MLGTSAPEEFPGMLQSEIKVAVVLRNAGVFQSCICVRYCMVVQSFFDEVVDGISRMILLLQGEIISYDSKWLTSIALIKCSYIANPLGF